MRVIFLRTTRTGQEPAGVIVFQDGKLLVENGTRYAAERLLQGVNRTDAAAVTAALRKAPEIYDGAYLRAAVEE
jgi:hypothetical protein